METTKKTELKKIACKIRMGVIEGTFNAKSGHPGGSLSIADIMSYLYFAEMNVDVNNPQWEDRDRFVLSKGHCAPALYAALAEKGFFEKELIKTLRKPDSMLQGHPSMRYTPGVDMSTGSLGQGISTAVGMALSAKLRGKDYRVYTILGDGEIEEGQVWEAAMFAGNRELDNLVAIVDYNNLMHSTGMLLQLMLTASLRLKRLLIRLRNVRASLLALLLNPSRVKVFPLWKTSAIGMVLLLTKNSIISLWMNLKPQWQNWRRNYGRCN